MGLASWLLGALLASQIPDGLLWVPDHEPLIVVSKQDRRLWVIQKRNQDWQTLLETEVDLGKNPGDKLVQNDQRTPEGIYIIGHKLTPPTIAYDLYGEMAFTLDYPNPFDRWQKKTGSGIWLHAVPDNVPLTRGSRGCIVMRNQSIRALEPLIKFGLTPVLILDRVHWQPVGSQTHISRQVWAKIEQWVQSWQNRDIETYKKFYHPDFVGLKTFNFDQWVNYKKRLFLKYQFIHVDVRPEFGIKFKQHVWVRLYQRFESDKYQDQGYKVLHWLWEPSGSQILSEDFLALEGSTWQTAHDSGH